MKTHLDLFSGIGGFALAARWNGYTTVGFCEIEPYAQRVLSQHWPGVGICHDIRNLNGADYRGVRLLTGGFPCQPFSVAGKRRGSEDDRHLWPEMCRVIEEARPTWIISENVPGIVNMELDGVLSDLESIGYSAWPLVVPACAVDARHRRDRVWVVAYSTRELPHRTRSKQEGWFPKSTIVHKDVAHADQPGSQERRQSQLLGQRQATERDRSSVAHAEIERGCVRKTRRQYAGDAWQSPATWKDEHEWFSESGMGRVAHGVPNRAHRLKGLGNAIVPQVASQLIAMIDQVDP